MQTQSQQVDALATVYNSEGHAIIYAKERLPIVMPPYGSLRHAFRF